MSERIKRNQPYNGLVTTTRGEKINVSEKKEFYANDFVGYIFKTL